MTMSKDAPDNDERYEPLRDARGRYVKGRSGNPDGRPRKQPAPPLTLGQVIARELSKQIAVNDNGTPEEMSFMEVLAATVVRQALKAKPKDQLHILERLAQLSSAAPSEDDEEEIFTEEDRRLLEIVQREFFPEEAQPGSDGAATDDNDEAGPQPE